MLPDFRVRQRDYLLEINRAITEVLDLEQVLNRYRRRLCLFGHLILDRPSRGFGTPSSPSPPEAPLALATRPKI